MCSSSWKLGSRYGEVDIIRDDARNSSTKTIVTAACSFD